MELGHYASLKVDGRLKLRVWEPDGSLADERDVHNIMCNNGLSLFAQAVNWAGIADVNNQFGGAFTSTNLTPVWGAVGHGNMTSASLGASLANGTVYTSITLGATVTLTAPVVITINSSGTGTAQNVLLTSNVTAASVLPVASFTANSNYAVGTSVGWVQPSDAQLTSELTRGTITQSTYSSGSGTASWTWTFLYGTSGSNWSVTEAGIFVGASSVTNAGSLLDHVIIAPSVSKLSTQALTLQATFTVGIDLQDFS